MTYRRLPSRGTTWRDVVRQAVAGAPHRTTEAAPPPHLHPASVNTTGAASGRLAAAFEATGNEQGEEQNLVAWLRKKEYFSRSALAGSAPA